MGLSEKIWEKCSMPESTQCLKGREHPIATSEIHFVLNTSIHEPFPKNLEKVLFGMGCFWGAERKFWQMEGVYTTAVGYSAGYTPNPTYEEVCTGKTGHNEVVLVVFDPEKVSYNELINAFWQAHDPTQGMRQGNDYGTQYRSGIYCYTVESAVIAQRSQKQYQQALQKEGFGVITTEIQAAGDFYYAEEYHQQYLAKNPNGYCGLGGTGVVCPA